MTYSERVDTQLPILSSEVYEHTLRTAREQLDINLIYNPHSEAEHAQQTAQHIPPHSLVFVEGFDRARSQRDFYPKFSRLQLGSETDRREYAAQKDHMLVGIDVDLMLAHSHQPSPRFDEGVVLFPEWEFTLMKSLIQKDCVIVPADIPDLHGYIAELAAMDPRLADAPRDFFRDDAGARVLYSQPGLRHTATRISTVQSWSDATSRTDHRREEYAVAACDDTALRIANGAYDTSALHRTMDGKITASFVYGSGHGLSLTHKVSLAGYRHRVTYADETPSPDQLISETFQPTDKNRAFQMLGRAAINRLAQLPLTSEKVLSRLREVPLSAINVETASQAVKLYDKFRFLFNDSQQPPASNLEKTEHLVAIDSFLQRVAQL